MDPAGKTAVVTGGNSGLGEATVQALLAAGARVVSLDLSASAPDGAEFLSCDVSDAAAVEAAVAQIDAPIHILVNSAGIGGMGAIASAEGPADLAAVRKVIEVNLVGASNATAPVADRMRRNAPIPTDGARGDLVNRRQIASF